MKKRVVTHNGAFHADDVCSVAVLSIFYEGNIEVIRTRDVSVIESGDIVLDVGGKADNEKHFDHHQEGGGGVRPNNIPYASFGLIWKRFGVEMCGGNNRVAQKFDKIFVQPVDALDNGVPIIKSVIDDVYPFSFNSTVTAFNPTWKEDDGQRDVCFMEAVGVFKKIIERVLIMLVHEDEARELVIKDYENADDKRIVVLGSNYPFQEVLTEYPEPLIAVYKSPQLESWHAKAVWDSNNMFNNRIKFPLSWAGKMNSELQKVSGVEDALFCHNKLFLATAKTKEGAITLAKLAIENLSK